jgi:50S ribosomal protein L16 3-hydroxylase
MTYSIGFRAPTTQEIATQFLVYMQDKLTLAGRYAEPDLIYQKHPAEMNAAMLSQWAGMIAQIQWGQSDIIDFAGRYLTEPKPHIYFHAPDEPMNRKAFIKKITKTGVWLSPPSRLLFHQDQFFINGERITLTECGNALMTLADTRGLHLSTWPTNLADWLYECYLDGYIIVEIF